MENLMTIEEAAGFLRRSKNTLYKDVQRGNISCVRAGRLVRFTEENLREFLAPEPAENRQGNR